MLGSTSLHPLLISVHEEKELKVLVFLCLQNTYFVTFSQLESKPIWIPWQQLQIWTERSITLTLAKITTIPPITTKPFSVFATPPYSPPDSLFMESELAQCLIMCYATTLLITYI